MIAIIAHALFGLLRTVIKNMRFALLAVAALAAYLLGVNELLVLAAGALLTAGTHLVRRGRQDTPHALLAPLPLLGLGSPGLPVLPDPTGGQLAQLFLTMLKIVSTRHYTDFAEMTPEEAASFGALLHTLDTAMRAGTDAERVHLVSTRDRVQHFHAWLYPCPAFHPLRGTDFLNAPQHSQAADADLAAEAVRQHLSG
ncbi:hypothetical protein [Streptosporangium roseum]|uniref:hypothetical protein n=1 Tax=Streptosporangium roseum TaxID=2001 RepID=UPI003321CF45